MSECGQSAQQSVIIVRGYCECRYGGMIRQNQQTGMYRHLFVDSQKTQTNERQSLNWVISSCTMQLGHDLTVCREDEKLRREFRLNTNCDEFIRENEARWIKERANTTDYTDKFTGTDSLPFGRLAVCANAKRVATRNFHCLEPSLIHFHSLTTLRQHEMQSPGWACSLTTHRVKRNLSEGIFWVQLFSYEVMCIQSVEKLYRFRENVCWILAEVENWVSEWGLTLHYLSQCRIHCLSASRLIYNQILVHQMESKMRDFL